LNVYILGSGAIGTAIAHFLSAYQRNIPITVVDINEKNLARLKSTHVETIRADILKEKTWVDITKNATLVIDTLPSKFGFLVFKRAINLGIDIIDVTYMKEAPLILHNRAKEKGIIAVPDAGVAPGLSNIIVGHALSEMEDINSARIYVGGLPKEAIGPMKYCITWSAFDLLEEYTRPARIKISGKIVEIDPLSKIEEIEISGHGKFESFYTDGLRTLLYTTKIPNMEEKTLRYVGHLDIFKKLRDLKLLGDQKIQLKGCEISPKEFLAKLLEQNFRCQKMADILIMEIILEGRDEVRKFIVYDEFDDKTGLTAMSRTTGFTASVIAQMVLEEKVDERGVIPPEEIGRNKLLYQTIIDRLGKQGIQITEYL